MFPRQAAELFAQSHKVTEWYNAKEGEGKPPARHFNSDVNFCPTPGTQGEHFFELTNFTLSRSMKDGTTRHEEWSTLPPGRVWVSEKREKLERALDLALKGIPKDGRPLVWTSRVASFPKSERDTGFGRFTNNLMCSLQSVG